MVQSLNSKVTSSVNATLFCGLPDYGQILIGDNAFEFYSKKNTHKYIQIPWSEVDYVMASVYLKGKWISHFTIYTKKNGKFTLSSQSTKSVLIIIREQIGSEKMRKSVGFFQLLYRRFKKR